MELTKTDEVLQEEQENILKNRDKLEIGVRVTYAKMCKILEIRYLRGNSKDNQIKRIKKYIEWGEDFIVKDNNKEINSETLAFKKTTSSEYYTFVRDCLLISMSDAMELAPNRDTFTWSKTRALKMAEIISNGFILSYKNKKKASELLGINTNVLDSYMETLRKDGIRIVESTLRQMDKLGYLTMSDTTVLMNYILDCNGNRTKDEKGKYIVNYDNASHSLRAKIKQVEREVLNEMYPDVIRNKRLFICQVKGDYTEYRKRVCSILKEKYGLCVDRYFEAFLISPNKGKSDYNLKYVADECILETKIKISEKMSTSRNKTLRSSICSCSFGDEEFNETIKKLNEVLIYGNPKFEDKMNEVLESEENEPLDMVSM